MPVSPDPVLSYCESVLSGETLAGRLVKLACRRHLDDLEHGHERGLRWDLETAKRAIGFFGFLRLAEGQFEGKPFKLEPFQKFIVGSLFGWKTVDGCRRFRTAYIEISKGGGKSPLAAGIGLYGLTADGENAAEIYSAANTREQAGIMFRDAKLMAEASPYLRKILDINEHNLAYKARNSFFRPVSSEHHGLDGKRPHIALIDEVHEHRTSLVVDKMRANTKGRRSALILMITNSGHDRTTVCWHNREFGQKVVEGIVPEDSFFAYICTLDPCEKCRAEGHGQPVENCPDCDDWRDPACWPKTNPGLGTILTHRYLEEQVREAVGMPSKENLVKRLNFSLWTNSVTHAIPMDKWDACQTVIDLDSLKGRDCYAGLDIGSTSDFTALALLFPHDDPESVERPADPTKPDGEKISATRRSYTLVPYFWLPENPVRRDGRTAQVIDGWRRQGLIRTTPGEVVDYDQVLRDIADLAGLYNLRGIAFDRGFQGAQMGTNLMSHFGERLTTAFPQGILSMSAPFREFLELIALKRLHHDDNPVLRWMASNCAAESRGGLTKPSKDKSSEKIDIITAAVMALGVAIKATNEESWYTPGCLSW